LIEASLSICAIYAKAMTSKNSNHSIGLDVTQAELSKAFAQKLWVGLAIVVAAVIAIAALFWIADHPFGTNWDEGRYINRAYRDVFFFRKQGLGGLLSVLVGEDRSRPPAYRLLALPFILPFGASSFLVRVVSLIYLGLSVYLTFLIGKRIAGATAGGFAAAFLMLCPIFVAPGMRFYVDYPFYLAIAAILYYLIRDWDSPQPSKNWIGLGLALGLGALAKPPILFVAPPVLLFTFVLAWRKIIAGPSLPSLFKACGLGLLITLPWWIFNFKPALAKAFRSGGFIRHSLGPKGSPEALGNWLYVFVQTLLGPALALLAVAIVVMFVLRLLNKRLRLDRFQVTAIGLCLVACLPTLVVGIVATNQNPRLIGHATLPLAIAIGVVAALTGWTTSRWLAATAAAIMAFQLAVMVSPTPGEARYQSGDAAASALLWGNPTNVMQRAEQWDWSKLRELVQANNITKPSIVYLGNGGGLTAPEIGTPWIMANDDAEIRWLWRYEDGEFSWDKTMASVRASNVVVTSPDVTSGIADRQDVNDNAYNVELIERLKGMPDFSEPMELMMGRFKPSKVIVFLRKPGTTQAEPTTKKLDLY